jgi:hypothetical protein
MMLVVVVVAALLFVVCCLLIKPKTATAIAIAMRDVDAGRTEH